MSSFLMAHQHILRYSVPYHGIALLKKVYNQGYLAGIKMNNKYIVKCEVIIKAI